MIPGLSEHALSNATEADEADTMTLGHALILTTTNVVTEYHSFCSILDETQNFMSVGNFAVSYLHPDESTSS